MISLKESLTDQFSTGAKYQFKLYFCAYVDVAVCTSISIALATNIDRTARYLGCT